MSNTEPDQLIIDRIEAIGAWLDEAAPYAAFDQQHLDSGTPERAYWHLGYRAALIDALALVRRGIEGTPDSASRYPSADPDA